MLWCSVSWGARPRRGRQRPRAGFATSTPAHPPPSLRLHSLPPPFNKADAIKAAKLRLFVRRGGPNYQAGLAAMRAVGDELGIPVEVHGPEASMTGICARAIEYVTAAA